jgi:hypothetical protein
VPDKLAMRSSSGVACVVPGTGISQMPIDFVPKDQRLKNSILTDALNQHFIGTITADCIVEWVRFEILYCAFHSQSTFPGHRSKRTAINRSARAIPFCQCCGLQMAIGHRPERWGQSPLAFHFKKLEYALQIQLPNFCLI